MGLSSEDPLGCGRRVYLLDQADEGSLFVIGRALVPPAVVRRRGCRLIGSDRGQEVQQSQRGCPRAGDGRAAAKPATDLQSVVHCSRLPTIAWL